MSEPTTSDLHQLDLHPRTCNALRRAGVHTVADLLRMGRARVSGLYLIGPFALHDIAKGLEAAGFCWTVEGASPLPELFPEAAQMVKDLGLGDSAEIRRGLARVLQYQPGCKSFALVEIIEALEHGAQ
jgi:hypothetical protein